MILAKLSGHLETLEPPYGVDWRVIGDGLHGDWSIVPWG